MNSSCHIEWLGRIEFSAATRLQKELAAKRAAGQVSNKLLLLEHPHTFTIGIDSHREQLHASQDELGRLNAGYHEVDRGGPIIYHGPGQLAVYPILDLQECGFTYHHYLELLEKVIIRALAAFKTRAFRERGQPGVWVFCDPGPASPSRWFQPGSYTAKIADIGVKVNEQNITSHGFFINVQPNLKYFDLIIPSGLSGCNVTSLRQVLNRPVEIGSVFEPVIQSFCDVFQLQPVRDETVCKVIEQQKALA